MRIRFGKLHLTAGSFALSAVLGVGFSSAEGDRNALEVLRAEEITAARVGSEDGHREFLQRLEQELAAKPDCGTAGKTGCSNCAACGRCVLASATSLEAKT